MNNQDIIKFFLQIAFMLACALFAGQIMRRFRQPAVLGELMGGSNHWPNNFRPCIAKFLSMAFSILAAYPQKTYQQEAESSLPAISNTDF